MKIHIIISSTREGRKTDRLANWVLSESANIKSAQLELVDLRDYELPIFNESISPRYNDNRKPASEAAKWLAKLSEADGYIIVTPEYNHSVPGVLKNALDYVAWETAKKPFVVVSHGTVGGARAAEHLKGIISEIQGLPLSKNVAFLPRLGDAFSENGELIAEIRDNPAGPTQSLQAAVAELVWFTDALAIARNKD